MSKLGQIGLGLGMFARGYSVADVPKYSVYLNGINRGFSPGNPTALKLTSDFTVSGWFKADSSLAIGSAGHIIGKWQDTTADRSFFIAQSTATANTIIVRLSNDGTTTKKDYKFTLGDITQWNHIAVTFEANSLNIYINGINATSASTKTTDLAITDIYDSAAYWAIGCANFNSIKQNFFNGYIDEVAIFNVIKTDSEIYNIYNNGVEWDMSNLSGLQAYWRFEQDLLDSSGNNNTLTVSPTILPPDISNNYSIEYSGSSQYVDFGNPAGLQILNNITVLAWVKATSSTSATNTQIVSKFDSTSGNKRSWTISRLTTANTVFFLVDSLGTGSAGTTKQYRYVLTDITSWNLIGFTFGSDSLKIYVNGTDVTSACTKSADGTVGSLYNTSANVQIGGNSADSRWFAGKTDEVQIYNSVLSDVDILSIYNGGTPLDESDRPGLVLYVRGENDVVDSSPSGFIGTNNSATFSSDVSYTYTPYYFEEAPVGTDYISKNQTQNSFITTEIVPGVIRKNPLSEVSFTHIPTTLTIGVYGENYGETNAEIDLYQDGTYFTRFQILSNGYSEYKFTGLNSGSKTITLRNGGHEWNVAEVVGKGTFVVRVFETGKTYTNTSSSLKRLVIVGDSISQGKSATIPVRDGWVTLVKADYPGNVVLGGGSGMSLYDIAADSTLRSNFVSSLSTYFDSGLENNLWLALCTNDYGKADWNAASYQTGLDALLTLLGSTYPSLKMWVADATVRTTETANVLGSTLDNYRSACQNAVGSKTNCTYVATKTWIALSDLADYVHPNSTGHGLIKAAVKTTLGY